MLYENQKGQSKIVAALMHKQHILKVNRAVQGVEL